MSDKRSETRRPHTAAGGVGPKAKVGPGPAVPDPKQGSANYHDRPSDDGKHGDAEKEPNEGFPRGK
jgi:hypothetical protein